MIAKSIRRSYVAARRLIRDAVIHNPTLDRWVGHPLRRVERMVNPYRWLLDLDEGGTLTVHGLTLEHRPEDGGVVTMIKLYGDYEPETRTLLEELLETGMTFVDGGAHIGYFSLLAARAVGASGRVFAFEPIADTRVVLERNARANGLDDRITVIGEGLADRVGALRFRVEPTSSVSNKIATEHDEAGPHIEVPVTSLDAAFAERDWPRCDVVKLDIEGAELAAFRGMSELARRNPEMKLIFEFHMGNLERTRTAPEALFDALGALGFDRFTVLFRTRQRFELPRELPRLVELAWRGNLNVLAERAAAASPSAT